MISQSRCWVSNVRNDYLRTCQQQFIYYSETHQDDFEVAKPLRKRNESDDYYLPLRSRDRSSSSIIQDGHKFVMDSVLLSIWGSQGAYRQERIRASSDSIGRNTSESNLQLQIDEYDQSSPQHNVNVDDGGITHGLATQSPVMPTEYMVSIFIPFFVVYHRDCCNMYSICFRF